MPDRLGRAAVRRLLDEHDLAPSRALGQNFVIDPNTTERIARLARIGPGDRVVEIGAGLGALTLALRATGANVTAIEVDRGLAALLPSLVGESVRVIEAEARTLDWSVLLADPIHPGETLDHVLVANLPYNVATPLVISLLEAVPAISRMLVMMQREVAERIAAPSGSRTYGAVSVRVAYFATARMAGLVSAEVFFPRPNVTSALIEITRRSHPAVDPALASYQEIDELVRAGFAGRRKMLRRSLAGIVPETAFVAAGVDPTARAEDLDVEAWGRLAGCRRSIANAPSPS